MYGSNKPQYRQQFRPAAHNHRQQRPSLASSRSSLVAAPEPGTIIWIPKDMPLDQVEAEAEVGQPGAHPAIIFKRCGEDTVEILPLTSQDPNMKARGRGGLEWARRYVPIRFQGQARHPCPDVPMLDLREGELEKASFVNCENALTLPWRLLEAWTQSKVLDHASMEALRGYKRNYVRPAGHRYAPPSDRSPVYSVHGGNASPSFSSAEVATVGAATVSTKQAPGPWVRSTVSSTDWSSVRGSTPSRLMAGNRANTAFTSRNWRQRDPVQSTG